MLNVTAAVYAKFRIPGIHHWPDAPEHRNYLSTQHRHVFHFEVRVAAKADNERSLEFHDLLDWCYDVIAECYPKEIDTDLVNFGESSCEMIARTIAVSAYTYFGVPVVVNVSEDDECGAVVVVERATTGLLSGPPQDV